MVKSNGYESAFAGAQINGKLRFGNVLSFECADSMPRKGFEEIFYHLFIQKKK